MIFHQGLEMTVVVRDRLQTESGGVDSIHLSNPHLVQVCDGSQVQPFRFFQNCPHDFRSVRPEFQSLDALQRRLPNPLAGFLCGFQISWRSLVIDDSWRDRFVFCTPFLLAHGPVISGQGNAANRGHAVCHPQLENVFGLWRLGCAAAMPVHVDEAWQDIHARGIDDMVRFRFVTATDRFDPIVLDHNIDWPNRRRSRPIDHDCIFNQ